MSDEKEKYLVKWTSKFKKDYKLAKKRGCNIDLLKAVVHLLRWAISSKNSLTLMRILPDHHNCHG